MSPDELDAVMRLKIDAPAARGTECPEDGEWPIVAVGLAEAGRAATLLRHAAMCDHCGPLLRQAASDFAGDVTAEEEVMLARLESSRARWQRQMASKLANTQERQSAIAWLRERLLPAPVPKWAFAAGLVLLAGASSWELLRIQRRPVDDLLAAAYTEQRTFELRIPNASYGPVRLTRGSGSRLDRPPVLLEGEARIARELSKHPEDASLLQAEARADLLEWSYGAAISALDRALKARPDSPSLMTDLASAYFQRAEAEHRESDYAAAAALLDKALRAKPDDAVALFNRAILHDRMGAYDQAIADWQRYLRVDPAGSWTSEAKTRLADSEKSKKTAK